MAFDNTDDKTSGATPLGDEPKQPAAGVSTSSDAPAAPDPVTSADTVSPPTEPPVAPVVEPATGAVTPPSTTSTAPPDTVDKTTAVSTPSTEKEKDETDTGGGLGA